MISKLVIRSIRVKETEEARRLIYSVAHALMEPQMPLEEVTAQWEAWGVFSDLDDIQKSYFENGGEFLVAVIGEQMVGTGAFHYYSDGVCELRRVALLPEVRGQRLGYTLMMELIHRARAMDYRKMCLWTNPSKLTRAVAFYHQLGFIDIPGEGSDADELWMEMEIDQPV